MKWEDRHNKVIIELTYNEAETLFCILYWCEIESKKEIKLAKKLFNALHEYINT